MKFAKEGWLYVLPFVFLAGLLFFFGRPGWGATALVVGLLLLLFFRDPKRSYEGDAGAVLAAADGLITRIDTIDDPEVGPGRHQRIVTFLSVLDVHVQKVPVAGEVIASSYKAGRKVAAFREDAGDVNEKHLSVIRRGNGDLVGVRQIAGLLARRVVCYLKEGDRVHRGQAMGLIKFSSRVDLLVPEGYQVLVKKGDRVKNGATPMALPGKEGA
ncbi:MAG TPA: phosphatidylserine decarboxylase [Thermoanaerobaculia bacterium]|jgi:phosphatidylserine decarboxylase|nr:phosphatidylserine decarboxylase [Thermoanaerobaculia bacterium]